MPTLKVFHQTFKHHEPSYLKTINVTRQHDRLTKQEFELYLQHKTEELETLYQHLKYVRVYLCIKSKIN